MIWAQDEAGHIGYQGKLPWHLPADLAHFKRETSNHIIVMGSKTFDSLPKVLPNRIHWVLTHDRQKYSNFASDRRVLIFTDLDELKQKILSCPDDIYIIGGHSLFDQTCALADELIVTKIHAAFNGDVMAPNFSQWGFELIKSTQFQHDEKNKYDYEIDIYRKLV